MRPTTLPPIERRRLADLRDGREADCLTVSRSPVAPWIWDIVDAGDREGRVEELFPGGAVGGVGELLVLQLQGRCEVRCAGDVLVVDAGDLLVLDVRAPALLRRSGRSRQLCLALPASLGPDHRRTRPPVALPGGGGMGMAMRGLLIALCPVAAALPSSEQHALRTAIAHLALEAIRPPAGPAPVTVVAPRHLLVAVQATIEARLTDPGLCPAQVAAIHGISTRQLHRRFREAGTSFSAFVRQRRLLHCCEDLIDPRWRRRPMTEIAFRWGFSDSAHFSRCFRAAFGCTARDFRAGRHAVSDAVAPTAP